MIHFLSKSVSVLKAAITGRVTLLNLNTLTCPCPVASQTALTIFLGK